MSIYIADLNDPLAASLQEYQPTKKELFERTEPWTDNIPRGEAIWNYGLKYTMHTEQSKQKIREFQTGRPKPAFTDEHKENIKKARANQVFTEETKRKISEGNRGKKRPTDTCPHCGKTGGRAQMVQWHFDNCKDYMFQ